MWRYKLINLSLLVFVVMLFINVVRSWIRISHRDNIIKQTQGRLEEVKGVNEQLKRQLAQVEGQEYVEKEGRNKLNFSKEGEVVLILPSISPVTEKNSALPDALPNWRRWIGLFL